MAEVFGIVTGAIGLAGLFQQCVECFEYVQLGRHFAQDFGRYQLKLDIAKRRLHRWGEAVNINENPRFNAPDEDDTLVQGVQAILEEITLLFQAVQKSSKRYNIKAPKEDLECLAEENLQPSEKSQLPKKASWALYDAKNFEKLIEQISGFLNDLEKLFPAEELNRRRLAKMEIENITDEESLTVLHQTAVEADPLLADVVKEKVKAISGLGTDPRWDKDRIEELKGGLLERPCDWIYADTYFTQWRNPQSNRLLWIKGDSGKGKTILLCSVINWLRIHEKAALVYFFCQKSDENLSSSAAVLRGLVYMLAREHDIVRELVQDEYKNAGRSLFWDRNAWYALKDILNRALQREGLGDIVIIVDALDECVTGIHQLLDLVIRLPSKTPRVKWIVSSRNESEVEQHFDEFMEAPILRIELGTSSEAASFRTYLQSRVDELAEAQCYDKETKMVVKFHLERNANANLHWVTLACQTLERAGRGQTIDTVHQFPSGLDNLYLHLFRQILESFGDRPCQKVLAFAAVVSRPISLAEFSCLTGIKENETAQVIDICHAFLTLQHETVYFVHQSAKDFLLSSSTPIELAPTHREIIKKSLEAMTSTLERDIYKLKWPGISINEFVVPRPDPLASVNYSCIFWADHLITLASESRGAVSDLIADGGPVDLFMRKSLLNWIEALSLLKGYPSGIRSIARLSSLLEQRQDVTKPILLSKLVEDSLRFMRFHQVGIENYPLQVYSGGLIFSPSRSLIRQIFQNEEPRDMVIKPHTGEYWSSVVSTFEGHGTDVVAMSSSSDPNGTIVASASTDGTIKVWDATTGECFHTLIITHKRKSPVSISSNLGLERIFLAFPEGSSDKLLSASSSTVFIWNLVTGRCEGLLERESGVSVVALSFYNGNTTECVTLSTDGVVTVWNLEACEAIKKMVIGSEAVHKRTLGPLSIAEFACGSRGKGRILIQPCSSSYSQRGVGPLEVWELETGKCLQLFDNGSTIPSTYFDEDRGLELYGPNIAFSPQRRTRGRK
ncbi:NACHT domain-containing protein [Fusarium sp. LHS14.1]|nr:NACHT domain-containing protein [Fusarium sp. LHS14.1]